LGIELDEGARKDKDWTNVELLDPDAESVVDWQQK
jgi:hypothetical protein